MVEKAGESEWVVMNRYLLYLVSAMLGEVGPGFRAVSLSLVTSKRVKLWFLLEEDRPEDRESIEDIAFEFDALASHDGACIEEVNVKVDARPVHQLKSYFSALPDARRAYLRREPEAYAKPNSGSAQG